MQQAALLPCYLKIIMFHGDKWIQLTMKVKCLAGRGATVSDFSAWQTRCGWKSEEQNLHVGMVAAVCRVDAATGSFFI